MDFSTAMQPHASTHCYQHHIINLLFKTDSVIRCTYDRAIHYYNYHPTCSHYQTNILANWAVRLQGGAASMELDLTILCLFDCHTWA